MDEMEEGKQQFLELVKGLDDAVQVVIPVTPSNSLFLISLTKGSSRKFITVPEDDIVDLPHDVSIQAKVTKVVRRPLQPCDGLWIPGLAIRRKISSHETSPTEHLAMVMVFRRETTQLQRVVANNR